MELLDSDLFKEWLGLAGGPTPAADAPLGPDDALVVIDMQADFLPHDAAVPAKGGAFLYKMKGKEPIFFPVGLNWKVETSSA